MYISIEHFLVFTNMMSMKNPTRLHLQTPEITVEARYIGGVVWVKAGSPHGRVEVKGEEDLNTLLDQPVDILYCIEGVTGSVIWRLTDKEIKLIGDLVTKTPLEIIHAGVTRGRVKKVEANDTVPQQQFKAHPCQLGPSLLRKEEETKPRFNRGFVVDFFHRFDRLYIVLHRFAKICLDIWKNETLYRLASRHKNLVYQLTPCDAGRNLGSFQEYVRWVGTDIFVQKILIVS